jgi:hypothetical protein
MTLAEIRAKWLAHRDEWKRLGVLVDGPKVADEIVADLTELDRSTEGELLSLDEASDPATRPTTSAA